MQLPITTLFYSSFILINIIIVFITEREVRVLTLNCVSHLLLYHHIQWFWYYDNSQFTLTYYLLWTVTCKHSTILICIILFIRSHFDHTLHLQPTLSKGHTAYKRWSFSLKIWSRETAIVILWILCFILRCWFYIFISMLNTWFNCWYTVSFTGLMHQAHCTCLCISKSIIELYQIFCLLFSQLYINIY